MVSKLIEAVKVAGGRGRAPTLLLGRVELLRRDLEHLEQLLELAPLHQRHLVKARRLRLELLDRARP